MPPKRKQRVLTVGLSVEEFDLVAPCLDRDEFDVDRFPSTRGALELVTRQKVDVLLVRYTRSRELEAFLRAVRARDSPCRRSPLLLLAGARQLAAAERHIGRGANRVVDLGGDAETIQSTVAGLLGVAPRKSLRFIAQLKIRVGKHNDWILCRTANGSTTGVLLETDRVLPIGTRIEFEFTLPAVAKPIVGRAEVTRHTLEGRDPVRGMGLRFLSFAGRSRRRYDEYLNSNA